MNTIETKLNENRWQVAALWILPIFLALPCFVGLSWAEGDLIRQFEPWKELGKQALQQHRWPLWNNTVYCGMPLLGNMQSALLYPLHLPFYFLDFAPALGIHLALHFFISGLGFYAFARLFNLERGPALLAALCWQANAFLLARVEFMSALSAYAYTPWLLWAVASGASLRVMALIVAIQAYAGYPLELAYSMLGSVAVLFGLKRGNPARVLGAWLLGLTLAAPVLLPGLELILHSSRMAGAVDGQLREALSLKLLPGWLWPLSSLSWKTIFTLSLPALFMSAFARGGTARWALGLMALGLALSFGWGAEWFPNRHPSLALVYVALGFALLTGLGAQMLSLRYDRFWVTPVMGLLILFQGGAQWIHRAHLVGAEVFKASPSARLFADKLGASQRFLASPALQTELESAGRSNTEAWSHFSVWLQANTASPTGLHDANGYDPLAPAHSAAIVRQLAAKPDPWLLDLMGVGMLADWDPKAGRFHVAFTRRKQSPLRALLLEDKDAKILTLDQCSDPATLSKAEQKILQKASERWKLKLDEASPEQISVSLPAGHKGGYVFLNDTFYPGWRAFSDGVEAEIHPALDAFRAVHVDAGVRELTMRYRPLSFFAGLIVAALAAFCMVFAFKP